jgi:hypothetical protein
MLVRFFLIFFFSCFVCEEIMSQWTRSDSIKLQEILSGERELKLDPEIQKSIESGTFLNLKDPFQHFIQPNAQFPILKEFTGIAPQDSLYFDIDPTKIPPNVFWLYHLPYINDYGALKSFHISSEEREYLKSLLPGATTFDAESILRYLFWKSHRAKVRNKKKATSWKYYNSILTY